MHKQHRKTAAPLRQQPRGHPSPSVLTLADRGLYCGAFAGGLGTFAILRPSWSLSWSCSRTCSLGLGLSLGLWLAEPETLCDAGMSTFLELRVSNVSKSTELAAAAPWDVGLDLLRLDQGLGSLGVCAHGLGIAGLHLLQALLVMLLGKVHVPQELGVYPLKRVVYL